ncbi:4-hydroxy-2-oxoglutarate aldolase, partial [Tremellales sp. Uapishka_1]
MPSLNGLNGHANGNGLTNVVHGSANGSEGRILKPGVWAPIPTFFDDNEDIEHVVRLAKAGMAPVVCGSMGEAHHLTAEERTGLIGEARKALDAEGLSDTILIAGCGGNSTRATISLCQSAAEVGADVAIVIPPGYYAGALPKPALKEFFLSVQQASPLPVMIYNFPGATGGIDMDSDLVEEIAREGKNICGIKLTCGAVGKLTRITAATAVPSFFEEFPRRSTIAPRFLTLGGFADFMLPSVLGGRAHGAIMGLGNIYPHSLRKLFDLSYDLATSPSPSPAALAKALALQDLVSAADASFTRGGIAGTKWYLHQHRGYRNGRVRRPLLDFDAARGAALEQEEGVVKLMAIEKALEEGSSY